MPKRAVVAVVALSVLAVVLSGVAVAVALTGNSPERQFPAYEVPIAPTTSTECVQGSGLLAASRGLPQCPDWIIQQQIKELERQVQDIERQQPQWEPQYPTRQPYVPYNACDDPLIKNSYACR